MKVLIVKLSSMGDILHTLPALTDARSINPDIQFDWVVEPSFSEIPTWHPAVRNVITAPLRAWKKSPIKAITSGEISRFIQTLRSKHYDFILDAQGLLKSALVACLAKGMRFGFDRHSARESIASFLYQHLISVPVQQSAVLRTRQLFAQSLSYKCPSFRAEFGIDLERIPSTPSIEATHTRPYLVLIHGTSKASKEWPAAYWAQLVEQAGLAGYDVQLPWGNEREKRVSEYIAEAHPYAMVCPKSTLGDLAWLISRAAGVVTVDTGLGHLACALGRPTLGLFRTSDPRKVFVVGEKQTFLEVRHAVLCKNEVCVAQSRGVSKPCDCLDGLESVNVWKHFLALLGIY